MNLPWNVTRRFPNSFGNNTPESWDDVADWYDDEVLAELKANKARVYTRHQAGREIHYILIDGGLHAAATTNNSPA